MGNWLMSHTGITWAIVFVIVAGLLTWAFTMLASTAGQCDVTLNMQNVTMHSGQLISQPNAQLLCVNGTLTIETRP